MANVTFQKMLWALLGPLLALFMALPVFAFDIQEVTSPGGIKAYLVESHAIPLISMEFSFDGGANLDPPGKEGTAQFLTGLMDEGADDMTGEQWRRARDHISMKLQFDVGSENFYGSVSTLSQNADEAFELVRKTITHPRLETEPVERMRAYFMQNAEATDHDQNSIAGMAWMNLAFPGHAYSRRIGGSQQSLATITREDILKFHTTVFSRNGLKVAVTGDIDAKTLGVALDRMFIALPDTPVPHPSEAVTVADGPVTKLINYDGPQTIFIFGGKGTRDEDADDFANFVLCQILGGQASFALLSQEVREKRGLTYGISYTASSMRHAGLNYGGFSTANGNAGAALKLVKETLSTMAKTGPTEEQLRLAKSYLTGGYALRFDSNSAIANYLLGLQVRGKPKDFANTRNDKINAVTRDQVMAAAKKYLEPDKMIIVAVGKPEGLN
jgi:zinc protease